MPFEVKMQTVFGFLFGACLFISLTFSCFMVRFLSTFYCCCFCCFCWNFLFRSNAKDKNKEDRVRCVEECQKFAICLSAEGHKCCEDETISFSVQIFYIGKKIRLSLAMKQCKVFSNNFSIFFFLFFASDDKRCFLCSLANNCLLFQNTDNSWEKSTQNTMDKNMATFYRNYHIIWFSLLWLNKCFIGPNRMPNDECAILCWTKDMVNFPLEIPFLGSLLYFVFLSFVGSTAHFHIVIRFCCPFSMCLFLFDANVCVCAFLQV